MPGTMTRSSVMKKKKKAPMKAVSVKSPTRAMEKMKSSSLQFREIKRKKKKKTASKNKMSGSSKFQ